MRILFVSNLYPPNTVGGYERLCFDVASELVRRGHQVSVLTSDHGGKEESYPGQSIDRSLVIFRKKDNFSEPLVCTPEEFERINSKNIEIFNKRLSGDRPDIVFVWNLLSLGASLINAIHAAGRKTVFLLTDYWLIHYANNQFMKFYFTELLNSHSIADMASFKAAQRLSKGRKTAISGNAIFACEFMRQLYTESGLRFSGSTVILHGINPHHGDGTRIVDRSCLVREPELRLLVAGRVTQLKGVHTAIQALPAVIQGLPELRVKLTILGHLQDRAYLDGLQKLIEKTNLIGHVEFHPPVNEEELFDIFQEHDLYLFPSLYEPFALTLIHALRAGIPTIVSDAGGNTEMVRDRENGLLFAKGDPAQLAATIVELSRDHRLRQALTQVARQHAGEFTINRMVDRIETYLTSML